MAENSIRGKTMILRPYTPADADILWESVHHEEFNRLTGTHAEFTREQIDNYINAQIANTEHVDRASFIIADPETLAAVGEVVINDVDHDNHSASIRISLFGESGLGKGYGSDAMRHMVDYGFKKMDLHRIALEVYAFNPRAIHVYEKIGFQREGILRDALYWDGEYIDAIVMSILKPEWHHM